MFILRLDRDARGNIAKLSAELVALFRSSLNSLEKADLRLSKKTFRGSFFK